MIVISNIQLIVINNIITQDTMRQYAITFQIV